MSSSKLPEKDSSSQFLITELNDSTPSFSIGNEDTSTSSTAASKEPSQFSTSRETVRTVDQEDAPEDYERKALIKIMEIKNVVAKLEQQISDCDREELQEQSNKIEEILIQKTLALDNTDTKNLESVKELRKNTIVYIQNCLKQLDSKIN